MVHTDHNSNQDAATNTKTTTINMTLAHEGTICWIHLHSGVDYFPLKEANEKLNVQEIHIPLGTDEGPIIAQSRKGCMAIGLGISDYSGYMEPQREKCHCGTFTTGGSTFLVLCQKILLQHYINIAYQTSQKLYKKTPTHFYLRVNSKSDAEEEDTITTETPDDTSRYIEIQDFPQYLGEPQLDSAFQVKLYNHDKSQCLAQVTQY